jgi:hypothetical protein
MIRLQELRPIDGLTGAFDSTRRGMSSVHRDAIGEAAMSAARTVLPARWFRSKPRRWPFVVAALLIATMIAWVLLMRQPVTAADARPKPASKPKSGLPADPDASDVVTGPVGSASLRDPATSSPEGADLSRLLEIEIDANDGQAQPVAAD